MFQTIEADWDVPANRSWVSCPFSSPDLSTPLLNDSALREVEKITREREHTAKKKEKKLTREDSRRIPFLQPRKSFPETFSRESLSFRKAVDRAKALLEARQLVCEKFKVEVSGGYRKEGEERWRGTQVHNKRSWTTSARHCRVRNGTWSWKLPLRESVKFQTRVAALVNTDLCIIITVLTPLWGELYLEVFFNQFFGKSVHEGGKPRSFPETAVKIT